MTLAWLSISIALAGQTGAGSPAPAGIRPKVACAMMTGTMVPASAISLPTSGAVVTAATLTPGTGPLVIKNNVIPEHCYIRGLIKPVDPKAPDIEFALAIPTVWNQQTLQIGGNGFNGFVPLLVTLARGISGSPFGSLSPPHLPFPITEGFATHGDDSGHSGAGGPWNTLREDPQPKTPLDAPPNPAGPAPAWWDNDEAFRNFGHEHIKKDYDAVMYLIEQMYGVRPIRKYFGGESQGGRAALMAALRYGNDYDGVIATGPITYITGWILEGINRTRVQTPPGAWIAGAKMRAIRDEVLRQCDSLDGAADGVTSNYVQCYRLFDGTTTSQPYARLRCADGKDTGPNCLSDAQLAAVTAMHAPVELGFPLANGETNFLGASVGQEITVHTSYEVAGSQFSFPVLDEAPRTAGAGNLGQRYPGTKFDFLTKTFKDYQPQIQAMSAVIDQPNDLSTLLSGRTKFIVHSNASDYVVNGRYAMRMYEELVKRHGQAAVDRVMRFYVTPNAGHSSAGHSATTGTALPRFADFFTPLRTWVEKGTAPDTLMETLEEFTPPYKVLRTRPLCRYPRYPRYKGSGSLDEAQSYTCAMPESPPRNTASLR
jgi:feruloyl esterase